MAEYTLRDNNPELLEQPRMDYEEWKNWASNIYNKPGFYDSWDRFGPDYSDYTNWWDSNNAGDMPGLEMPMMNPQMGMGFNVNVMSEAGQNSLETFLGNIPGAKDFMSWYIGHVRDMLSEQPEAYPAGFDLDAPENERRLMAMQMQRLGQIPDLASAYEGAY